MKVERLVRVTMSESSARATLSSVRAELDSGKWRGKEWMLTDAIIELTEAIGDTDG